MSDENPQGEVAAEPAAVEAGEAAVAPAEPKTETLDDVYAEFNVQPRQEQAQPVQPQGTPPALATADPITDADGFKAWQDQVNQRAALMDDLRPEVEAVRQEKLHLQQQRLEGEVNQIVDRVHADLEGDGVSKKFIKLALADEYASNDKFKALVDNRYNDANGKKAFDRALKAIVPKLREDLAVKHDPQLAEDSRAMREAMKTSGGPAAADSESDRLSKMSKGEFAREWSKIRAG